VQRQHPAAQFLPRSPIPASIGFPRCLVGPATAHLSRTGGRRSGTVDPAAWHEAAAAVERGRASKN
jgi:hypothetical protein